MSFNYIIGSNSSSKPDISPKDSTDMKNMYSRKEAKEVKERKLNQLIYPSLTIYETSFLSVAWIFILIYSWYLVYTVSRKYYLSFVNQGFMIETWFSQFLSYQSDFTDHEWNVSSWNLMYSIPWIFFHFFGSQILRKTNKNIVPIFNVLLSMIYMGRIIGIKQTIWILCQPLFMFVIHLMESSLLTWIVALTFLFVEKEISGPVYYMNTYFLQGCTDNEKDLIHGLWHWVNLRCVSFCLDRIWKDVEASSKGRISDLVEMLAYCFYLPVSFSGPIIIYKDFHEGFNKEYQPWTIQRFKNFLLEILRYSFWLLIGHVVLHFFYPSSIQYDMKILTSLGLWTLAGVGLSIGGFFQLKYVIFYGWPRPFVMEDGINKAPPHPKCIYRITRYSEMWRYFDNGLYLFLQKYIYQPIVEYYGDGWKKMIGATFTFTYIYLWHQMSVHIMLWSIFNYLSVMTEMLAITLGKNPTYINLEKQWLSPKGQRRFHAALVAPLFVGSVLANFYFFMESEVGHYFVYRAFTSWPIETPLIFIFAYIGVQFSIEVKNRELRHAIYHEWKKYE